MSKQDIEREFPGLLKDGYSIISPPTPEYNCIAWAAGDSDVWWEPDQLGLYYWPIGVPREYTLEAYMQIFEQLGYSRCDNAYYEEGFEKIVIYAERGISPTHAARQLSYGKWTSKLGQSEDIEHTSLDGLVGPLYGSVFVIMKRPKQRSDLGSIYC